MDAWGAAVVVFGPRGLTTTKRTLKSAVSRSGPSARAATSSRPASPGASNAVPWVRPAPPRPLPEKSRRWSRPTPALFYGIPEAKIVEWARVSPAHARLLKMGVRKPSRQVERLVSLHRDERVLYGLWKGWICRGDKLVSPEGVEFNSGVLRHHALVMQFARELAARVGGREYRRFWELLA